MYNQRTAGVQGGVITQRSNTEETKERVSCLSSGSEIGKNSME
jgi:hypothetical protein